MKQSDKLQLFSSTFQGRTDVVPRFWKSKDDQRVGYSPLCRNEWKKNICKKPCRNCFNADHIPLSASLLIDHLKGDHILGCYPLRKDNTCYFTVCDFDNHAGDSDPLQDVKSFYEACQVQDIPCYALRSKSGKGYHAYVFFSGPVTAWKARAVVFALLREASIIGEDAELSSFDRLFPNQDKLSGKGLGNLIALPFQGVARKKGHTLFLAPGDGFKDTFEDQWEIFRCIERVPEPKLDELIQEWGLTPATSQSVPHGGGNPRGWVSKALAGVGEGARDDTGTKLAGYFTRKQVPPDVIFAILRNWNKGNTPPLEPYEVDKIVQSVGRYQNHGDPRHEKKIAENAE